MMTMLTTIAVDDDNADDADDDADEDHAIIVRATLHQYFPWFGHSNHRTDPWLCPLSAEAH